MKRILVALGLMLALAACSYSPDFETTPAPKGKTSSTVNTVTMNVTSIVPSKGIVTVTKVPIVAAAISLLGPDSTNTMNWVQGGQSIFVFDFTTTGIYTVSVTETDASNNSATYGTTFLFESGYNYYVNITLGGKVIVLVQTNYSGGSTNTNGGSTNTNTNSGGTFGIYSETVPVSIDWANNNAQMQIWNGFYIAPTGSPVSEGLEAWMVVALNGNTWGGFGVLQTNFTGSSVNYTDLSAYTALKFSINATTAFTKIGIKDWAGNEGWISCATLISSYGLVLDGNWHTITVPLSVFTGVNLTQINQYFMFNVDTAEFTPGNIWYIDNVYFQ